MTDVLIAGAGPTGLTLACEMARRGAGVRIVDQRSAPHRESRGKTLHPDTLELLEGLDVAGRLAGIGSRGLVFRKYFDGAHVSDTPYEGALFVTSPPPEGGGFSLCRLRLATDQPGP
ncbi:FAD-dependent monooxygenase [Streptomyces sp. H27-S2]|uniref:FAD-dependent monooxygenase n=1 Tax=Streptomyces antarcticus TaxID=2996458 RepID=UPI002D1E39E4|nr:FAD-dependent monooxygenase [Streptomyces sp. H27-S2]